MKTMSDIDDTMTTAELEAEKHARDAEVQRLRGEMVELHKMLEVRWIKANYAAAGKPDLMQTIGGK